MGDYTKTTYVEGVTQVGPTNLNKSEQGIADATKQASMDAGSAFDGTTATTNDKKRITWRRTSDGSYLASSEGYETGSGATQTSVVKDRVGGQQAAQTTGASAQRVFEVQTKNGTNVEIFRIIMEAIRGGGGSVKINYKTAAGADPSNEAWLLTDSGYSDWVRVTYGTLAARPAATAANQNQFYVSTIGQIFVNITGSAWLQLAGAQEAATITTPATGFGTHYLNYNSTFRYWKDMLGYTHVTGEINDDGTGLASVLSSGGGAIIWDGFPSAYRPTDRKYFTIETNVAGQTNHILINSSGQIRVSDNFGNNPGRYMNFGHITFPTF